MALSKSFAQGDILTATDVNTHLAHHVPTAGDPYDTDWVPLSVSLENFTAGQQLSVRRLGTMICFRGYVSGDFNANSSHIVLTLPAGFRPIQFNQYGSAVSTNRQHVVAIQVSPSGLLNIQPSTSGQFSVALNSFLYPVI